MSQEKKITPYLSATAGSTFSNWLRILSRYRVERKYFLKAAGVTASTFLGLPFQLYEKLRFSRKLNKMELTTAPVFIIGHWRSGTTLLHYLLGKDPQMGYISFFQTMFPEYLASENIYKVLMKKLAPRRRLVDNMRVGADLPQEEEFGLGNTFPLSFFHCFYFPQQMRETFGKAVLMENLTPREQRGMEKKYLRLIKKASLYSGKSCLVVKNPANTARIPFLLKMFPDAKFIYLKRDPVTVFYSTFKLWKKTLPALTFQDISDEEMKENIILLYRLLMEKYLEDRSLIPEGNLIELQFEEFEKDKLAGLETIYRELGLSGFEDALPHFELHLESIKGYTKNHFEPEPEMVDRLTREWAFAFREMGYDVPSLSSEIVE